MKKKATNQQPIITVIRPNLTFDEKVEALKNLQKTVNDIANSAEERGVDTSNWFYSQKKLEELKNDPNYIFV